MEKSLFVEDTTAEEIKRGLRNNLVDTSGKKENNYFHLPEIVNSIKRFEHNILIEDFEFMSENLRYNEMSTMRRVKHM